MSTIFTHTGLEFDTLDPRPEMIRANDIAISLSRQARFNGHTRFFYSVAQHSVLVSERTKCPLSGLLHDAAEAYIGDLVRPVKQLLPDYDRIEGRIQAAIEQRFDLLPGSLSSPDVAYWDDAMLSTELADMLREAPPREHLPAAIAMRIVTLPADKALALFNERFHDLLGVWPLVFDAGLVHGEARSYAGLIPGERL